MSSNVVVGDNWFCHTLWRQLVQEVVLKVEHAELKHIWQVHKVRTYIGIRDWSFSLQSKYDPVNLSDLSINSLWLERKRRHYWWYSAINQLGFYLSSSISRTIAEIRRCDWVFRGHDDVGSNTQLSLLANMTTMGSRKVLDKKSQNNNTRWALTWEEQREY